MCSLFALCLRGWRKGCGDVVRHYMVSERTSACPSATPAVAGIQTCQCSACRHLHQQQYTALLSTGRIVTTPLILAYIVRAVRGVAPSHDSRCRATGQQGKGSKGTGLAGTVWIPPRTCTSEINVHDAMPALNNDRSVPAPLDEFVSVTYCLLVVVHIYRAQR